MLGRCSSIRILQSSAICFEQVCRRLHVSKKSLSNSEFVSSANEVRKEQSQNTHSSSQEQQRQQSNNKQQSTESIREKILIASLKYVPQHGWSNECLALATKELGLPPLTHRIVRRGSPELVQYIMDAKRYQVQQIVRKYQEERAFKEEAEGGADHHHEHGLNHEGYNEDHLKVAITSHLEYLQPYRSNWAEAIAISLDPRELSYSLPSLLMLIDDLCDYAEIKTSRLDWYTERALMLYLYCSTELFMLTDKSTDLIETKSFLEQNLKHYQWLRKSPKNLQPIFRRFF